VWQRNIALNLLMLFMMAYLLGLFVVAGIFLEDIILSVHKKSVSALSVFNSFIFYYLLADMLSRIFFQSLPVIHIQPYLHLPIRRSLLVHNVIYRALLHGYSLLPLALLIPFYVVTVLPKIGPLYGLIWLLQVLLVLFTANLFMAYLKRKSITKPLHYFSGVLIGALVALTAYQQWLPWTVWSREFFDAPSTGNIITLIPAGLAFAGVYYLNFQVLRHALYPEDAVPTTQSSSRLEQLLDTREGNSMVSRYLLSELKMMLRNKRTRSVFFMSLFFSLYGLVFYLRQEDYGAYSTMFVFAGVFTQGAFLMMYGQFLFSWESAYMDGYHARPMQWKAFVQAKWILMAASVFVMFLLSLPMGYFFGIHITWINLASAVFNVGFNSFVMVTMATYNKKRIDLGRGSTFNWQGVGATQWLVGLPTIFLPAMLYLPFSLFEAYHPGLITLASIGVISLVFYKGWIQVIVKNLKDRKYQTLEGYRIHD
jgi:hypothetical protein